MVTLYQNLGANGQAFEIAILTELTTVNAAATTDTAIQIPAGAMVVAVPVRVVTAIPTAVSFNLGIATVPTRYGTALSTTAGTTNSGMDDSTRFYSAATAIRITPNLLPSDSTGQVRITIYYYLSTPPTS